jgi:hypothetical protein
MLKLPDHNSRIILFLAGLHLFIIPMALILTKLIGTEGAIYGPWGQLFPVAIMTAQCQLLAIYCVFANHGFGRRVTLFIAGLLLLILIHAATVYFIKATEDQTTLSQLLVSDIVIFVAPTLLSILFFFAVRPLLGCLSINLPNEPEQYKIISMFVATSVAAVVCSTLIIAQRQGVSLDVVEVLLFLSFQAALAASCLWTTLAKQRLWIGLFAIIFLLTIGMFLAPEFVVSRVGHWFVATYLILFTFLLCGSCLVVRTLGYRLQKYGAFLSAK